VAELVRSVLRGQASAKVVLASLEGSNWQGPVFETYRTQALLERYPDRVPASAASFDTFRESQGTPDA